MIASAVLVDRIAGAIDGEVITYSDVRIERALELSEGSDREILQRLIDRRLLLREAERFKITEGDEDIQKIQKRLGDIKARMGEDQFHEVLREYNLTEADILKMLKEDVLAEKFINFRVNFFVVISNDAIKAYYSEHQDEFRTKTLEGSHDEIKERLFQIESKRRLEEYIEQLRKKVKISVNL
ncbi:MAG: SurA N-terminal domain-containing protein [Nitrospirae bacterium]|nr:SurA N-terminal domain-containing protein [Nitrospirota bacterium]